MSNSRQTSAHPRSTTTLPTNAPLPAPSSATRQTPFSGSKNPLLARLDDLDALRAWADSIVAFQRNNDFRGGCPLGTLANELAENDTDAREDLATGYRRWQHAIRAGLAAIQDRGELLSGTDVDRLATALLTTLQGGLLLTKTLRDSEPLETALHTMIDHIESFTTATTSRRSD